MNQPQTQALTVKEPYRAVGSTEALRRLAFDHAKGLERMLPAGYDLARLGRTLLVAVDQNPDLLNCTRLSLVDCLTRAAELGLELSGTLGHAYMVPFNDKRRGGKVAQFVIGYQGLCQLMYRTKQVQDIEANCVYAGDLFEWEEGTTKTCRYQPASISGKKPGKWLGAYALIRLTSGGVVQRWMAADEIEAIRKSAPSGESPAWTGHRKDEMRRKTVLRNARKLSPVASRELAIAEAVERRLEGGELHQGGELIELLPTQEEKFVEPAADAPPVTQQPEETKPGALARELKRRQADEKRQEADQATAAALRWVHPGGSGEQLTGDALRAPRIPPDDFLAGLNVTGLRSQCDLFGVAYDKKEREPALRERLKEVRARHAVKTHTNRAAKAADQPRPPEAPEEARRPTAARLLTDEQKQKVERAIVEQSKATTPAQVAEVHRVLGRGLLEQFNATDLEDLRPEQKRAFAGWLLIEYGVSLPGLIGE